MPCAEALKKASRLQHEGASERAIRMGYVSTVAPNLAAALRKKMSPGLARGALPSPAGAVSLRANTGDRGRLHHCFFWLAMPASRRGTCKDTGRTR